MTKVVGMAIRVAGNEQIAGALAESAVAMELKRVQRERDQLREELRQCQEALSLVCWAREQENGRRLAAVQTTMRNKRREPSFPVQAIVYGRLLIDELFKK